MQVCSPLLGAGPLLALRACRASLPFDGGKVEGSLSLQVRRQQLKLRRCHVGNPSQSTAWSHANRSRPCDRTGESTWWGLAALWCGRTLCPTRRVPSRILPFEPLTGRLDPLQVTPRFTRSQGSDGRTSPGSGSDSKYRPVGPERSMVHAFPQPPAIPLWPSIAPPLRATPAAFAVRDWPWCGFGRHRDDALATIIGSDALT